MSQPFSLRATLVLCLGCLPKPQFRPDLWAHSFWSLVPTPYACKPGSQPEASLATGNKLPSPPHALCL